MRNLTKLVEALGDLGYKVYRGLPLTATEQKMVDNYRITHNV